MHDQREEEWMKTELTLQELMKYKPIVREYCALSVKQTLTEAEADRIDEILQQAELEPMLNLLIEEADHLVAHELNIIDEAFIAEQRQKLQMLVHPEIKPKSEKSETVEIQKALKQEGLYTGAIDGVCGPRTQEAIKQLRSRPAKHWILNLISPEVWSTC